MGTGMRNAVGFYWTLPVPWAGFTRLPPDVDEAAEKSRTIRYQTALIRDFARSQGYRLIAEKVFIELEPDRSSPRVREPLEGLIELCRRERATILYVDFSHEQGWRSHPYMDQLLADSALDILPVSASPVTMDGAVFDPFEHFSDWRKRQQRWIADKDVRAAAAARRAIEIYAQGHTFDEVADMLNREGLPTPTGKAWSGDNLRKFLKARPEFQELS